MFGYIKKTKAADLIIKSLQQISYSNFNYSNGIVTYGFNNAGEQLNAYATIDDVYSIVRKIAKTCKRIPLYVYEVKDEKSYSKFKIYQRKAKAAGYTTKSLWDLKELQTKSMEIIGDDDPLQHLLDNPNDFQSKDEFDEAAYSFPLLTGNELVYVYFLTGAANKGLPYRLVHLPPNYMKPVISETITNFSRRIIGWKLQLYGAEMPIQINSDEETVIHRKYFNPIYDYSGNQLLGLSPLCAGQKRVQQAVNESDYVNRSLLNAGAEGFITNKDKDFNIETWGSVKEDILKQIGAVRDRSGSNINAKTVVPLLGDWVYNSLAISPADMKVIEQRKMTKKGICDLYGVSDTLFNNDDGSKYDNRNLASKELIINVCLPEITSRCESLNKSLVPRFTDKIKRDIGYDISDIPELQEDSGTLATRFSNLPGFKPNDLREAQGFGRDLGDEGEQFVMKQGYMPLSDVLMPATIDTTALDNANANDYNK